MIRKNGGTLIHSLESQFAENVESGLTWPLYPLDAGSSGSRAWLNLRGGFAFNTPYLKYGEGEAAKKQHRNDHANDEDRRIRHFS